MEYLICYIDIISTPPTVQLSAGYCTRQDAGGVGWFIGRCLAEAGGIKEAAGVVS